MMILRSLAVLRFNPRTPAGCDIPDYNAVVRSPSFNPRTPAGCDRQIKRPTIPVGRFNPRTPAGCDSSPSGLKQTCLRFQSTHPCGVRPLVNEITL